ncbi:hypothetical protein A0H76_3066, partial [Hepatospora eriocheir]
MSGLILISLLKTLLSSTLISMFFKPSIKISKSLFLVSVKFIANNGFINDEILLGRFPLI